MTHERRDFVVDDTPKVMWVRGALVITALLLLPFLFPRFQRASDPNRERIEIAQAIERRQCATGEAIVSPSGELRRAVVLTHSTGSAV